MTGVGMIVALLPQRVMDYSGSVQSVGLVASAFAISYLIVQLPVGTLADRLGAKPFLVFGYVLCAVSGLVFFYAGSSEAIFLGRFVQGAGEAPVWALGPAVLALAYPQARGKAIGIYNASIHAGLTAGPLLGILLFPAGGGNMPFLIFAAMCCIGGVAVLLYLPSEPLLLNKAARQTMKLHDAVALLRLRGPLVTLPGIFMYGAGYGIFVSVLPASLMQLKDFGSLSTVVFFALFYAAISLAQLFVGPLSDRQGRHGYMIAGCFMAATGFASFTSLPQPWTYAPLTLASFGLGIFCVSSMAYLNDCVPASLKGTISAGYFLAWGLGYLLGPVAIGLLDAHIDAQAGYHLIATLFAVQAALQWLNCRAGARGP